MNRDKKAIIHVDMDAFYAAVEQRDNPELVGLPVIVGGIGVRSVVATASYEARAFGVRSAMSGARARNLCPSGVFIQPRMQRYRDVSAIVFSVFNEVTPQVEGLSLDEAFLDVTQSQRLLGDIETIGHWIKREILHRTGLIASIGMAHNKFLAKMASELGKPDGFLRILPHEVQRWLDPLPVGRLWTVGHVTQTALYRHGIHTIAELRNTEYARLSRILGDRHAEFLQKLACGEDQRSVENHVQERSISVEHTFDRDLKTLKQAESWLLVLCERLGERVRQQGLRGRNLTLKLRKPPFVTATRQCTFAQATHATEEIYKNAKIILNAWWREHSASGLRLLGVGLSGFSGVGQLDLFTANAVVDRDALTDRINRRFGRGAIRRGRALKVQGDG